MSSTTAVDAHEKPVETIEKEFPKSSKMINIQLKTLLLMMILNNLKHQEKIITV